VALDNVHVHFLPRPGFDLEGLVISDDPAFSDEPMVRAQEVSAAIRLRSLFRGRLEIATLSATEPSINLVRNQQGRWNLASLIERSAQIPAAPTAKPASESRPAFPYLEANHARINFKIGQAKKSWALNDADVALWQDSENEWGGRMKAQPVRTDFNLTDTGLFQLNATWQRAASLGDTPMHVSVQWEKGQLGQITKLFSGRDRGWRGGVSFSTTLAGTPKALQVKSQIEIEDFHRYDIMSYGNARMSTVCSGRYGSTDGLLRDLACESPVGGGSIGVRGTVGPVGVTPSYDLTLKVKEVPLSSVLQLVREAKKELPADLAATGLLDAEFHAAREESGEAQVDGRGKITDGRLSVNDGKEDIAFGDVPLALGNADMKHSKPHRAAAENNGEPPGAHLAIGPFPLGMGAPGPATAGGWISASGYRLFLRGDSEVRNVYRLAHTLGVSEFRHAAQGLAKVDLNVSGSWQGFAAPAIFGTAQFRNVRTGMRALNPPIDIASATLKFQPDTVSMEKISARTGDTRWSGSVRVPRPCAPTGCIFQFDLAADQVSSAALAEWFTPQPAKRPWYRILTSGEPGKSPLLAVQAKGTLRIGRLSVKNVDITQIAAHVDLDRGKATLADLRAQVFQGVYEGRGVVDASIRPPRYQAEGTLQTFSLAQLSAAMNDPWVTGTADARLDLVSSGTTFSDILSHADGELTLAMQNGTFAHVELPEAAKPFPVHVFSTRVKVKNGVWNLNAGKLQSRDGIYQISGTASPGSGLDLVLTRGDDQTWNVTGTLLKPRLVHANRTQARTIKP
jgi:hypothetical protein